MIEKDKIIEILKTAGLEPIIETEKGETLAGADNDGELDDVSERFRTSPSANAHPTLKPFSLNARILKLFKTPNPQTIFIPFSGAGSEIIGAIRAGFTDWFACEINPEFITIAEARIKRETMQENLF
jgi:DNA modification methylase